MDIIRIQISRSKSIYSRPWCFPLKRTLESAEATVSLRKFWRKRIGVSAEAEVPLFAAAMPFFAPATSLQRILYATFECMCDLRGCMLIMVHGSWYM